MMQAWEYTLNTAMLGTDKPYPGKPDLPDEVAHVIEQMKMMDLSKETKFLNTAAIILNYRQCGFVPPQQKNLPVDVATPETKPYCSNAASDILNEILAIENAALLELWLTLCDSSGQLTVPGVLPVLLDKAAQQTNLQTLTINCCGSRARWLSKCNHAWNYFNRLTDEEVWLTGKPEERVKVLKQIRETDPAKAREMLKDTWNQEDVAAKTELLKCLSINSSTADLPWIESLLNEKGQKIKDEVLTLLKRIPGSSIVQQYEALLGQSVVLKKEKTLLGMMNKTSIQLRLPAIIDESIFKSGIGKLSGQQSKLTDEEYIIYQLISATPPPFWEKQFNAAPAQVVEYFEKYAVKMIPALAFAISRFNEKQWIPHFLHQEGFCADFINMLPPKEKEKYLLRFLSSDARGIIQYALLPDHEWSPDFATAILNKMAAHPYEYNSAFFNKHIKLIPVRMLSDLEKIEAKDTNLQQAWEKAKAHLSKLLTIKQQTLQAFNT